MNINILYKYIESWFPLYTEKCFTLIFSITQEWKNVLKTPVQSAGQ
jgi:hypothetical protein